MKRFVGMLFCAVVSTAAAGAGKDQAPAARIRLPVAQVAEVAEFKSRT